MRVRACECVTNSFNHLLHLLIYSVNTDSLTQSLFLSRALTRSLTHSHAHSLTHTQVPCDTTIEHVGLMLQWNNSLHTLNLAAHRVSPRGADILFSYLELNNSVRHLCLAT